MGFCLFGVLFCVNLGAGEVFGIFIIAYFGIKFFRRHF